MSSKLDVFDITKDFVDDEVRLTVLLNLMNSMYENCKEEVRNKNVKSFVTKLLEHYSHEDSRFRSDARLLQAWNLLGKTSTSLGYEAVMKKLDNLGYFKNCPEFYRLWGEHCVEKKDRITFDDLFYRVNNLFKKGDNIIIMFNQFADAFGPRPMMNQDDGATENFFDKLGVSPLLARKADSKRDSAPSTRAPLAVVDENSERASSTHSNSNCSQPSPHLDISGLPQQSSSSAAAAPSSSSAVKESPSTEKTAAPASNYSFTTHLYRGACDAFGETLPLSQETMQQPPPPLPAAPQKEFSVYVEKEDEPMDQLPASPVPAATQVLSHRDITRDSPVLKKARNRRDSDEDSAGDNPFGDIALPKPRGKSLFEELEDATLAGFNRESTTRASSTPTRGNPSVPTFEVSPTATFPLAGTSKAVKEENQPFTFAPRVAPAEEVQKASESSPPPLSDAIGRMSIAPEHEDLDATTHDITIMPDPDIKSGINPWSDSERQLLLSRAPPMVEQHEFLSTKCPPFGARGGSAVELGGEKFKILNFIAQGGFARIYKSQGEDGKQYAIKLEMPACPWEVYICKALSKRLPSQMLDFVMSIRDAFIFSNASAIVYDYFPLKTLLDLANSYQKEKSSMDGMLVAFVGIQMAEVLNYVHQNHIIHADVKPDNFVIVQQMSNDLPQAQYGRAFIKLIDWGRAIDMTYYPNTTFKGRAGTNGFDCHEMQEDRPWTYQTDFYGFVGTMHVLMFNTYMKTYYHSTRKVYAFTEQLKRRYPLCETWTTIFRRFLNIESCESMPSWSDAVLQIKADLEEFAVEDVATWRRGIEKCNSILRNATN